jgi:acyl-CoA thioesterase
VPFKYTVTPLFDGATFSSRTVLVTQSVNGGEEVATFSAVCHFKLPDNPTAAHSIPFDKENRFRSILSSKTPEEWPIEDGVDAPWYRAITSNFDDFKELYQGVQMRLVVPETFADMPLEEKRTFHFYRPVGDLKLPPSLTEGLDKDEIRSLEINLHATAHLYASDRNSLFHITNLHEASADIKRIASITHSLIFHGTPEEMLFSESEPGKWFVQEVWSDWSGNGRGLHNSRLWRWPENGPDVLVGSSLQDGLIRYKGPKI